MTKISMDRISLSMLIGLILGGFLSFIGLIIQVRITPDVESEEAKAQIEVGEIAMPATTLQATDISYLHVGKEGPKLISEPGVCSLTIHRVEVLSLAPEGMVFVKVWSPKKPSAGECLPGRIVKVPRMQLRPIPPYAISL